MKRYGKFLWSGFLSAAMLFLTCSCADTPIFGRNYRPVSLSAEAKLLSAGFTPAKTAKSNLSDTFTRAMAQMAFRTFAETLTDGQEGNRLYSPLSAAVCLAMLQNGTSGDTRAQLESLFGLDTDTLNTQMAAYLASLPSLEGAKFVVSDSLWIQENFAEQVKSSFLQANADYYDAAVYRAPFDDTTVSDINAWVSNATDGMIREIINKISREDMMYLINALVFDAKWATPYEDSAVRQRTFTPYEGKAHEVTMLYSGEHTYLSGDNVTGFVKNYEGDGYAFVALLPEEGVDVMEYAASLTGESWLALWEGRRSATVNVLLPEFTYEGKLSLTETLEALGVDKIFSGEADFSAMSDTALVCGGVYQKTFIELSRKGTKAAAVTWANMKAMSAGPVHTFSVFLDRPFVYAIVDTATGLPIFLGVLTDVTQ